MQKLHASYCDLVALGCLAERELSEELVSQITKLSIVHDADSSSRPHRRLKQLLSLVFNRAQIYCSDLRVFIVSFCRFIH